MWISAMDARRCIAKSVVPFDQLNGASDRLATLTVPLAHERFSGKRPRDSIVSQP
jgi:hypothetical protein